MRNFRFHIFITHQQHLSMSLVYFFACYVVAVTCAYPMRIDKNVANKCFPSLSDCLSLSFAKAINAFNINKLFLIYLPLWRGLFQAHTFARTYMLFMTTNKLIALVTKTEKSRSSWCSVKTGFIDAQTIFCLLFCSGACSTEQITEFH